MQIRFPVVVASIVTLVAVGFPAPKGAFASGEQDPCNPAIGAITGGLLGALSGGKKEKQNALIGAGAGALACFAINIASRQLRSAQDVENDYKVSNAGKLPADEPVVQSYKVNLNPGEEVQSGNEVKLVSNVTVVSAINQPVNEVKEVMTLVGPESTRTLEKKANEKPGSGTYENTFKFAFPKGMSPGTYPIKTELFVNGKAKETREQNVKLIAQGERIVVASLDDRTNAAK